MLLLTFSSACTSPGSVPLTRDLPSSPGFAAAPSRSADIRAGESCWIAYDRKRGGERINASIVDRYNVWYAGVRQNYSKAR